MAKANQAYHKRDVYNEVTARIHPHNAATSPPVISPAQVMTLAEYFAKQAVIAQWKAEGKRQTDIEVSELHQEANATFDCTGQNSGPRRLNVIAVLLRVAD